MYDSYYYRQSLRKEWESLIFLVNTLKSLNAISEKSKLTIIDMKKRIRSLNKSYDEYIHSDKWGRVIGGSYDDYDRRGMKYVIPRFLTPKEVQDEIERTWQHWYNPYEDGRDCTGVWFTTSILVFPIKGADKTIVYHVQHMDC